MLDWMGLFLFLIYCFSQLRLGGFFTIGVFFGGGDIVFFSSFFMLIMFLALICNVLFMISFLIFSGTRKWSPCVWGVSDELPPTRHNQIHPPQSHPM